MQEVALNIPFPFTLSLLKTVAAACCAGLLQLSTPGYRPAAAPLPTTSHKIQPQLLHAAEPDR